MTQESMRTALELQGRTNLAAVYHNLPTSFLCEEIVRRREGRLAHLGPLVVRTGHHTGRAPNDKFVVREPSSEEKVWWGPSNQPLSPERFEALRRRMLAICRAMNSLSRTAFCALFERRGYPFEYETIPRNIAYYAGRLSRSSTLCCVVCAWVMARSDRPRAMDFFGEALQSDVSDIQQGTTAKGVHLGAVAGTVDLVPRVSTGIEVRGDILYLAPELPRERERLDMRIRYRGHSLDLRLTRDSLTISGRDGAAPPITLCVDGEVCEFVSGTTHAFRLNDGGTHVET